MNKLITRLSVLTLIFSFSLTLNLLGQNMVHNYDNVKKSAEEVCPLKVGQNVPDPLLRTIDGKEISLKEILNEKPTVLVFYRGGWCPYCNMQLSELRKIEKQIIDLGYHLIAISMDTPENLKASLEKDKLNYQLYSDSKADAVIAFGLAFTVDEKLVEKYKTFNIDLEKASGEKHHILPVPAVFIVDKDGIIKFEYANPNYKVRLNSELLLEAAKVK